MPIPAALWLGALAAGGTIYQTNKQQQEAQANRRFQADMSNTAVQRSVADYKAAGLNPALAYDRSASSPSGAVAQIGDPISAGISSAMRQREFELQKDTAHETQANIAVDTKKKAIEAANAQLEGNLLQQDLMFRAIAQPADQRQRLANAALLEYQIPAARNQAGFEDILGRASPTLRTGLGSARTLAEIFRMMRSGKR